MLNQSLGRLRLNPSSLAFSLPVRPVTPSSAATATASANFTTRSHQRRNSSSKPPIPPHNGAPPIPTAVKQVGTPRADKRPTAPKRSARKSAAEEPTPQDHSNEWVRSLPFVPSTQHLNPKDVYVASFFGTHRPISISGPMTPEASMSDIDKIFSTDPKRKTQDVIYTISSAINNLEPEMQDNRADLIKTLTQDATHLDGAPKGNVKVIVEALARRFRPFNAPPAPVAAPEVEFGLSKAEAAAEAAALEEPSAVVSESNNAFFTPSFVPSSSKRARKGVLMVEDYIERMQSRRKMFLISVKRQRRLKMKKHKYKKLQRATRNLRRRQGKI